MLPGQAGRSGAEGCISSAWNCANLVHIARRNIQRHQSLIRRGVHGRNDTPRPHVASWVHWIRSASASAAHQPEHSSVVENPLWLSGNERATGIGSSVDLLDIYQSDVVYIQRAVSSARGVHIEEERHSGAVVC